MRIGVQLVLVCAAWLGSAEGLHTKIEPDPSTPVDAPMQPMYPFNMYNATEWSQTLPTFTEKQYYSLMPEAPGANLCYDGHLMPEILVFGAIKAGTTSLCTALAYSPSMQFPMSGFREEKDQAAWKESHHLDKKLVFDKFLQDYGVCDPRYRKVGVDGSARYGCDPEVPRQIIKWYGVQSKRIKFVLILREPLARLHSHYWHGKEGLWCTDFNTNKFGQIIDKILTKTHGADSYQVETGSPLTPGCSDFLEGSLYTNQIRNFMFYFSLSQFAFIPTGFVFNPSGDHPAQLLWKWVGVLGMTPPVIHSNDRAHPALEDDLNLTQCSSMRRWFTDRTSSSMIASMITDSNAHLYGFSGPRVASHVASWIETNW